LKTPCENEQSIGKFIECHYAAILAAIFVIVAALKSFDLFIHPRFWAEEGSEYFPRIQSMPGGSGLLLSYRGNFQLFENMLVWLATLVPLDKAPFITTYGALAVHTVVAAQLGLFIQAYNIPKIAGFLLVVAWAFLPSAYEVWLTATNVQWVLGCSALLIALMPLEWLQRHRYRIWGWFLVCGLSGIPSVLVAPVVILRFIVEKSSIFVGFASSLAVCAVIQILVLKSGGSVAREFSLSPTVIIVPTILQTVITPLFGNEIGAKLLAVSFLSIALIGLFVAGLAVWAAKDHSRILTILLPAWGFITIVQVFASIGASDLLRLVNGSRYFMVGSLCFCLTLALGMKSRSLTARCVAASLLSAIALSGIGQRWNGTWPAYFLQGPAWAPQIDACTVTVCKVLVWPSFETTVQKPSKLRSGVLLRHEVALSHNRAPVRRQAI
jgi:hypothetical protein